MPVFAQERDGKDLANGPVRETLVNQLGMTSECLTACEALLCQIRAKISGTDSTKPESKPVSGASGLVMDVMARSQRIRNELEDLNSYIG